MNPLLFLYKILKMIAEENTFLITLQTDVKVTLQRFAVYSRASFDFFDKKNTNIKK